MVTFVRFYRKRTWHILDESDRWAKWYPTLCGEPSINSDPRNDPTPDFARTDEHPAYLCERCEKRNP